MRGGPEVSATKSNTGPKRRGRPPSATRSAGDPKRDTEQRVEAVERALSILDAFTAERPSLSLAELAERTGFYPGPILRLRVRSPGSATCIAVRTVSSGSVRRRCGSVSLYRQAFNLTDYARPALARLVERTGETAAFYVRDGDKRICLYRQHTQRLVRHHLEEGAELPLDVGASAHVLMAFTGGLGPIYERVRAKGFYFSIGERDPETAAIAAPVFGRNHEFLGALGNYRASPPLRGRQPCRVEGRSCRRSGCAVTSPQRTLSLISSTQTIRVGRAIWRRWRERPRPRWTSPSWSKSGEVSQPCRCS